MDDSSMAIARYWDAAASCFDEEPDHGLRNSVTRAAWAAKLADWLPDAPADVLDVGSGTGSLSLLLAQAGHRVTGIDLAPAMVALAEAKLAAAGRVARFLVGDAGVPPTGEGRFDVVLARHLLWTLPDPQAALGEWISRLRPGGRLVLVEGRWRRTGPGDAPYAAGVGELPWDGGVGAEQLAAALRPLVAEVRIEPLSAESRLWGKPVDDERYAITARI